MKNAFQGLEKILTTKCNLQSTIFFLSRIEFLCTCLVTKLDHLSLIRIFFNTAKSSAKPVLTSCGIWQITFIWVLRRIFLRKRIIQLFNWFFRRVTHWNNFLYFHPCSWTLDNSTLILSIYRDKICVYEEHLIAGRDIQYQAPDSWSGYTTPFDDISK